MAPPQPQKKETGFLMMCHVCSNESDSFSLSTPPSKGRKRRKLANSTAMSNYAGDSQQLPADYSVPGAVADPRTPLLNLSTVRDRMDSLQQFLAESVNSHTLISTEQMNMVSSEISAAIHQIILNGAALLACSQQPPPQYSPLTPSKPSDPPDLKPAAKISPPPNQPPRPPPRAAELNLKVEAKEDVDMDCNDIVEMDAVELLAEHVHFCEMCGKGFKRDANLRMHMRAHGNQFKTAEALAKPDKLDNGDESSGVGRSTRFSCPFEGCNRNKKHSKFRPLKSVICVRNHFKRSHCPKIYSCNRCNKSFSVVADLKSHLKHCGESRWKCSCGTSFSRKDKLFGHMALFEGHMPAVVGGGEEEEEKKGKDTAAAAMEEDVEDELMGLKGGELDSGFFDGFLDGFGSMEGYSLQDILRSPIRGEEFCGFLQ